MQARVVIFVLLTFLFNFQASAEVTQIVPSSVPAAHGMYLKDPQEIWLADTFNKLDRVSGVYNLSGNMIVGAPSGTGIAGISKHPLEERMSFCDVMGSQIVWIDTQDNTESKFSIENPWNARWNSAGSFQYVVTYSGSIYTLHSNGETRKIVSDLDAPFDIAPVGENSFWVSEQGVKGSGQVCLYEPVDQTGDYKRTHCNRGVQLENPEGMWPLPDGGAVAVDTEAGLLVRIFPDGSTKILEKDLGLPIMVQVLAEGNWVAFTNQSSLGPAIIFGKSAELDL